MTSTASSAGRTGPAEARSDAARRRWAAWAIGAFGAAAAWIGWMNLSVALGFPEVSPADMLNRTIEANPGAPLGWALLLGGLVVLAVGYLAAASRALIRPGLASGTLFGLAVWLVTGAVLMPLMGIVSSGRPSASALMRVRSQTASRETFMMVHLGILAAVGALIAWSLFGAVLGATSSWIHRERKVPR